eukprot:scaffold19918_cov75-Phaeocystis_antarctica.AAC.3
MEEPSVAAMPLKSRASTARTPTRRPDSRSSSAGMLVNAPAAVLAVHVHAQLRLPSVEGCCQLKGSRGAWRFLDSHHGGAACQRVQCANLAELRAEVDDAASALEGESLVEPWQVVRREHAACLGEPGRGLVQRRQETEDHIIWRLRRLAHGGAVCCCAPLPLPSTLVEARAYQPTRPGDRFAHLQGSPPAPRACCARLRSAASSRVTDTSADVRCDSITRLPVYRAGRRSAGELLSEPARKPRRRQQAPMTVAHITVSHQRLVAAGVAERCRARSARPERCLGEGTREYMRRLLARDTILSH